MNNPDDYIKKNSDKNIISKIQNIVIPNFPVDQQNTICNYIKASIYIIETNNNNINMYIQMKNSILENIPKTNMNTLSEIISVIEEPINKKLIYILRNSLSAGEVNLYQDQNITTLNSNYYYLIN